MSEFDENLSVICEGVIKYLLAPALFLFFVFLFLDASTDLYAEHIHYRETILVTGLGVIATGGMLLMAHANY